MRIDLFRSDHHLPSSWRATYRACMVIGSAALFFALFCIVFEVATVPGATTLPITISVVSALIATVHVFWEARSATSLTLWRWAAFLGAISVLAIEAWVTFSDPQAKQFFVTVLILGSLALLAGRVIYAKTAIDDADAAG
ncbi:MAG: hypothetical protein KGS45_00335 [Planctomycetes bacterium]|nr:hypothetical protein [Planctomycetota bacterium]